MGALVGLQDAGLVRHIGASNVSADELARGRGVVKVVSVQDRYNLTDCHSDALAVIAGRA